MRSSPFTKRHYRPRHSSWPHGWRVLALALACGTAHFNSAVAITGHGSATPLNHPPQLSVIAAQFDALARQRATLTGVVKDEHGAPVAGVTVELAGKNVRVRTDRDGKFAFANIQAGTWHLQFRRIGLLPLDRTVTLVRDQPQRMEVIMSQTVTLADVNVVGKSAVRAVYDERRERGLGIALDTAILNHRSDIFSALTNLPLTQVIRSGSGTAVELRSLSSRGRCSPATFLDGLPAQLEMVTTLPPSHFRAIEALPVEQVPEKFRTGTCGVLLFWSRAIKW